MKVIDLEYMSLDEKLEAGYQVWIVCKSHPELGILACGKSSNGIYYSQTGEDLYSYDDNPECEIVELTADMLCVPPMEDSND